MADKDLIAFNVASFICALFVLEFGADKFIDHTAIVARRIGVSQALIGLLTAGAEWEELVVVIVSVARNRSSLAIGTVIGSTISNVLGAFSLGLLFHSANQEITFDRSSKIYTLFLLILTLFVTLITVFGPRGSWKGFGGILLALFLIYVASVASAITRGMITAPEASDTDDSDAPCSEDSDSDCEGRPLLSSEATRYIEAPTAEASILGALDNSPAPQDSQKQPSKWGSHRRHSLTHHLGLLLGGFASICLSGYVLSHASTTISDEIGMSDVLFAIVFIAIATTLPEKFIAVLSGSRGQTGILVANTVGSNIFLLTLCIGIVLVVSAGDFDAGTVNAVEVGVMMGSTVALTITVWFGARWSRYTGAAMLIVYIVFLVLEFTTIRKA